VEVFVRIKEVLVVKEEKHSLDGFPEVINSISAAVK